VPSCILESRLQKGSLYQVAVNGVGVVLARRHAVVLLLLGGADPSAAQAALRSAA